MTTFAYCRVSTIEQNLSAQKEAIKKKYSDAVIREEKASGTSRNGRPVLELIIDMATEGDKIVIWKLDRLARNTLDLMNIVQTLENKGVSLEILDQAIDTSTASGKAFLQMLGVFAEFETNLRKERQQAGIAKAKEKGIYKGRQPTIDVEKVKALKSEGKGASTIAKQLGISRASVYRVLE